MNTLCHRSERVHYIAEVHCPNFRALSDFRKNNAAFFHDCFKQTIQLALELKLASLGRISLDGSKFQVNSSKHKAMSYKRLQEKEQELTEEKNCSVDYQGSSLSGIWKIGHKFHLRGNKSPD
ncbi:MAG: hypothetical protein ACRERU_07445 [Methylococcales bacterium]